MTLVLDDSSSADLQLRLTTAYHNIMLRAFFGVHNVSLAKHGAASLPIYETANAKAEAEEAVSLATMLEEASSADAYHKELRVKSMKSYQWLNGFGTPHRLLVCVLVNSCLEAIMYKFLHWQTNEIWLKCEQSPLVIMASSQKSPATKALGQLSSLMTIGALSACDDDVPWRELMQGQDWTNTLS